MENVTIIKGNPASEVGGKLNSLALDYMAYPLIGSNNQKLIETTFDKLWMLDSNRFSHQYAFEAQINEKTLGIITCYPVTVMKNLAWSTFEHLMKLRKWDLVDYALSHVQEVWSMISLNEGRDDEYHIGSIATLPESRGYGIGSRLIGFAEKQAKIHNYNKCSLTVKQENKQALKLYEKLGYQIVNSIDKNPYLLYRMVKNLACDTV